MAGFCNHGVRLDHECTACITTPVPPHAAGDAHRRSPVTDTRQAYIDGLHQIADFLAEHPEVPLPHLSSYIADEYAPVLTIWLHGGREALVEVARAMGSAQKTVNADTGQFKVYRQFAGVKLVASADRKEVCERVVVATREITEEVPDPEALAAVPKVSVTKTVEDVEWVCSPLLAKAPKGLVSL